MERKPLVFCFLILIVLASFALHLVATCMVFFNIIYHVRIIFNHCNAFENLKWGMRCDLSICEMAMRLKFVILSKPLSRYKLHWSDECCLLLLFCFLYTVSVWFLSWRIHRIDFFGTFRQDNIVLSIISIVDCDAGRSLTLCSCCFCWKFSTAKFIRLCCSPFHWKILNISNYHSFSKHIRTLWCYLHASLCSANTGCSFCCVVVFALYLTLMLSWPSSLSFLLACSQRATIIHCSAICYWAIKRKKREPFSGDSKFL